MKLESLSRKIATLSLAAAALILFVRPSFAQEETVEVSAAQGSHWKAEATDGTSEQSETPATDEAPATAVVPASHRPTPAIYRVGGLKGMKVTANQDATPPAVDEGQSLGVTGLSQGTVDNQPRQGSNSTSATNPATQAESTSDSPNGPRSFPSSMSCTIKDFTKASNNVGNNHWTIPRNGCISIKFTTGKSGHGEFDGGSDTYAPYANAFTNISRNAGDFDYSNLDSHNGCAYGRPGGLIFSQVGFYVNDSEGSAVKNTGRCSLDPEQTYYINIRNENPSHPNTRGQDSCQNPSRNAGCGGVFIVQWTWGSRPATTGAPGVAGHASGGGSQCNALMCSGGVLQLTSYNFSPPPPPCAGQRAGQACSSGEGCKLSQPVTCGH